jgi:class 3 adenylate cyclase
MSGDGSAHVLLYPGTAEERKVEVKDRLYVGRECAGIDDDHRLLVDGPDVSRNHVEIRLDVDAAGAFVIDTSTNGTRLNGVRIERSIPIPLKSGDVVRVGDVELQFDSDIYRATGQTDTRATSRRIFRSELVMVVGDVIEYSTISEQTDDSVLAASMESLYTELRVLLRLNKGTLSNVAGDAFFAVWEREHIPDAAALAVEFACAAGKLVDELSPGLAVAQSWPAPVRMGFGVVLGEAAVSTLTGALVSVLGDDTNVAFRLSALAGRDGRPDVLVTEPVQELTAARFSFDGPVEVMVKGRSNVVTVYGVKHSPGGGGA